MEALLMEATKILFGGSAPLKPIPSLLFALSDPSLMIPLVSCHAVSFTAAATIPSILLVVNRQQPCPEIPQKLKHSPLNYLRSHQQNRQTLNKFSCIVDEDPRSGGPGAVSTALGVQKNIVGGNVVCLDPFRAEGRGILVFGVFRDFCEISRETG